MSFSSAGQLAAIIAACYENCHVEETAGQCWTIFLLFHPLFWIEFWECIFHSFVVVPFLLIYPFACLVRCACGGRHETHQLQFPIGQSSKLHFGGSMPVSIPNPYFLLVKSIHSHLGIVKFTNIHCNPFTTIRIQSTHPYWTLLQ